MDMDQNLLLALKAAREAGKYLVGAQKKGNIDISWKHEGENYQEPITKFDKESQRIIQETLALSGLPFWGEESEKIGTLNGWIVDPIDGTGSFAKGSVVWGVSIALIKEGKTEIGVIALPQSDVVLYVFPASRVWRVDLYGIDTTLKKVVAIPWRNTRKIGELKLVADIPFNKERAKIVNRALSNIGECKTSKSATFHMMQVLSGQLDAYYQEKIANIFDVAAACLIAKRANAIVTLTNGEPFELMKDNILVARNERIARAIIERVKDLS